MIDALYAAVAAEPDDADARLVLADAIGGDRGELIVLEAGARDLEQRRRVRELVTSLPVEPPAVRVHYVRGLPTSILTTVETFVAHTDAIARAYPLLDGVALIGTGDASAVARAAHALPELRAIDLFDTRIADLGSLLAALPSRIDTIGIGGNGFSTVNFAALDRGYRRLWLRGLLIYEHLERLGPFKPLRGLDIIEPGRAPLGENAARAIFSHPLEDLAVTGLDDRALMSLLASPAASTLQRLVLDGTAAHLSLEGLAQLPKLSALEVRFGVGPYSTQVEALAKGIASTTLGTGTISELRISSPVPPQMIFELAKRTGAQLQLLSLSQALHPSWRALIEAHVGGELIDADVDGPTELISSRPVPSVAFARRTPSTVLQPAYLVGGEGELWPLAYDRSITCGRGATADIVIRSIRVARQHARFERTDEGVVAVEDLRSTTSLIVNGERVMRRVLEDGDELSIGDTPLRFFEGEDAEARAKSLARSRAVDAR